MNRSTLSCTIVVLVLGAYLPGCGDAGEGSDTDMTAADAVALEQPTTEFRAVPDAAESTQKGCSIPRTDVYTYITIGSGSWGGWAECYEFCPAGTFAYSIAQLSEPTQGGGDDTALNGVRLQCYNRTSGTYQGYITSQVGPWGDWLARAVPNPYTVGNPIKDGRMKIEAPVGSGDDTAANALQLRSMNGSILTPNANTAWGTWNSFTSCPAGTAICGVKTRLEGNQGGGDDTALNGVAFA